MSSVSFLAGEHPGLKGVHFPLFRDGKYVDLLLLYTELYSGSDFGLNNYIGTMKSKEIGELIQEIKEEIKKELNIDYIDWGYACGRCVISTDVSVLSSNDKLFTFVNAFLKRGKRVYMQDSTQVTFSPEDYPATVEKQQELLIDSLESFLSVQKNTGGIRSVMRAPVNNKTFWTTERGHNFCDKLIRENLY